METKTPTNAPTTKWQLQVFVKSKEAGFVMVHSETFLYQASLWHNLNALSPQLRTYNDYFICVCEVNPFSMKWEPTTINKN